VASGWWTRVTILPVEIGDITHYAWCMRMQVSNSIAEVDNERQRTSRTPER
jgi:hypothetical protein